jgi:hypothetical protein
MKVYAMKSLVVTFCTDRIFGTLDRRGEVSLEWKLLCAIPKPDLCTKVRERAQSTWSYISANNLQVLVAALLKNGIVKNGSVFSVCKFIFRRQEGAFGTIAVEREIPQLTTSQQ